MLEFIRTYKVFSEFGATRELKIQMIINKSLVRRSSKNHFYTIDNVISANAIVTLHRFYFLFTFQMGSRLLFNQTPSANESFATYALVSDETRISTPSF